MTIAHHNCGGIPEIKFEALHKSHHSGWLRQQVAIGVRSVALAMSFSLLLSLSLSRESQGAERGCSTPAVIGETERPTSLQMRKGQRRGK